MGYKKMLKTYFPLLMGMSWDKAESKEQWKDFKANAEKMWDQFQDMQKQAKKAQKEQWANFFAKYLEMQQTFADTLPDEKFALPGMPAAPVSPKEFVEKMKEFQEKANNHAVEQDDSRFEYFMQGQEKVKESVSDVVDNIETKYDEVTESKEEE